MGRLRLAPTTKSMGSTGGTEQAPAVPDRLARRSGMKRFGTRVLSHMAGDLREAHQKTM